MSIEITTPLVDGVFVERINRFVAIVEVSGQQHHVHVTNTGRMKELLIAGADVLLRKASDPTRKTQFTLYLVKYMGIWVSLDSTAANVLVYRALQEQRLAAFAGYDEVRREVTYGHSRFDIALSGPQKLSYIEVKCCTLVSEGIARFPDAPTDRGRKHVYELMSATRAGYQGAIIFVAQRSDARIFRPNDATDPAFGKVLREAAQAGVNVLAYRCDVKRTKIEIVEEIPVEL